MNKKGEKYSYSVSLGSHDSRLAKGPAPEYLEYCLQKKVRSLKPLFEPIIQYHQAHILEFYDKKILSKSDAIRIIKTLRWIREQGLDHFEPDPRLGGLHPQIEAILINELGEEVGGKVLTGRARADPERVASWLFLREKIVDILEELNSLRRVTLEVAEKYANTLMPGYTLFQHAQPTTVGHYMLCIAEALENDYGRFNDAFKRVNMSNAEHGIGQGTAYPIDRKRVSAYLGFEGIIENTRYALTSFDRAMESLAALSILTVTIDRFLDDIAYWCTYEFSLADLGDEWCGTSYIMPQKKNPESIGGCVAIMGRSIAHLTASMIQASRCSFGMYNHPGAIYLGGQMAGEAIEDAIGVLKVVKGNVSSISFNEDRMTQLASESWEQASELADTLFREKGLSFRTAHKIVGTFVRESMSQGKKPFDTDIQMLDKAAVEITGNPVHLSSEVLRKALDPIEIVKSRKVFGGTAPEAIEESIKNRYTQLSKDLEEVKNRREKLVKSQEELEKEIQNLISSQ